ncbi:hypothetical protein SYNTR_2091 [Candidatus Syntrophocurvum alkaliphilum]|uniref:Uncharacterized protein n=1 Tax=Candidatus Syntrophocurvum alkaliphilum TaxID=2293317 RepID=A0A6I6DDN4_9FIRM|nr:hypothetical protein [Candidatus Syntrophocurvum alkaliphilum]QGU00685.1 hypothetical protein SYNTR_2091 [Candidatus Syntrophocurvum alkaliphilum]
MKKLSQSEMISLREMLQVETNTLASMKAMQEAASDEQLQRVMEAGVLAAEGRIKGLQQFISENRVIETEGVH